MSEHSNRVQDLIQSAPIMVFMKGTPDSPLCGFSKTAVDILRTYHVDFGFFNVLDDAHIREAIKTFSDWPTFPQVYIQGELIGGCDILKALHASGDLAAKLCLAESQ